MYHLLVYTNNQWIAGEIIEDCTSTIRKYIHFRDNYFTNMSEDQLQQQSLVHQQQVLQLQQQLDTERRMRRNMALQLDKIQESNANKSHSNTSTGKYYL